MSIQMIKKPLFLIPVIMAAAVGLVAILAWNALRPINQKNGFKRDFIASELRRLDLETMKGNVSSIAGVTDHHVYFKTKDPSQVWVTDNTLQNGKYVTLNVPNHPRIASAFFISVDSPLVHVMAVNGPAVIKTDMNGGRTTAHKFPTALFTRAIVIGPDSYVFRGFDTTEKSGKQIFIKGNPRTGELQRKKNIAETEADRAGLVTDGQLAYDERSHRIMYVSHYQNRFFCLDTNLNLVYSGHTIDTMSTYRIEAGKVNDMVTNTSPARLINSKTRIENGKMFILSKLPADNEEGKVFAHNAAVDIYDVINGSYMGSFYIPFYKREKISDFKIKRNTIIVLYKTYVARYGLPPLPGT
jgi:hypothetical protein